ncbi:hypothetical protein LZ30DRAFT_454543 [Colletotrichum cereale]|nr:hypothetical protein LZ30DRAFT_454543 [Colletotrichum cereale]
MAMISATTTEPLTAIRDGDDDVIFLGSRTATWCASACMPDTMPDTLPTAMASATTRTTSPPSRDHNDDVAFLCSRTAASQLTQRDCQPRANDRKPSSRQSPRRSPKKQRTQRGLSYGKSTRKVTRIEYAHVGWITSARNQPQAVYGSFDRNGQLRYWSDSPDNDCETIEREDIRFRSMFQELDPTSIREMLLGKMQRASIRSLRNEK